MDGSELEHLETSVLANLSRLCDRQLAVFGVLTRKLVSHLMLDSLSIWMRVVL